MAKKWHQLEKLDHRALKKLQIEREKAVKAQEEAAEKTRKFIIAGAVCFGFFMLFIFMWFIKSRSEKRAFAEAREKLKISKVVKYSGSVKHRHIGLWLKLKKKLEFSKDHSFKTEKKGSVSVQLQLENVLKLSEDSEMTVFTPVISKTENKIEKEKAKLKRGELTVAIALDGRDLLEIETGGIIVSGASGLFKIIYDKKKNKGEVVVKNGLVKVYSKRSKKRKAVKVSGFYKVAFSGGVVKSPTQASVIQYDWR
jgi:hypothetical protein